AEAARDRLRERLQDAEAGSGRVAELEAELEKARHDAQRADDERALRRAAEDERNELMDRIASLERDVARLESAAAAPPADAGEKDQLHQTISRLRGELEAARAAPPAPTSAAGSAGGPPSAGVPEALGSLEESLADLRGSLRAASDEAAVLPGASES